MTEETKEKPVGFFMTVERIYDMMVAQEKSVNELKSSVDRIPDNAVKVAEHEERILGLEEKVSSHSTTLKIVSGTITGVIVYIAGRVIGLIG